MPDAKVCCQSDASNYFSTFGLVRTRVETANHDICYGLVRSIGLARDTFGLVRTGSDSVRTRFGLGSEPVLTDICEGFVRYVRTRSSVRTRFGLGSEPY